MTAARGEQLVITEVDQALESQFGSAFDGIEDSAGTESANRDAAMLAEFQPLTILEIDNAADNYAITEHNTARDRIAEIERTFDTWGDTAAEDDPRRVELSIEHNRLVNLARNLSAYCLSRGLIDNEL